ncbi:hypothetical protein Tco_0094652 [Tanacetum coccineum]
MLRTRGPPLKHEGTTKFGEVFGMWQKDAPKFDIDGHYPMRELWDSANSNSTLKNHISHPHCEALKRVAESGQSSMTGSLTETGSVD